MCIALGFFSPVRDPISFGIHGVPTLQVDISKHVLGWVIHAHMPSHDLAAAASKDAMLTCITFANFDALDGG